MAQPTERAPAERSTAQAERRLTHEQAAALITQAGERYAATPAKAKAFLKRVGILDATGVLAQNYR